MRAESSLKRQFAAIAQPEKMIGCQKALWPRYESHLRVQPTSLCLAHKPYQAQVIEAEPAKITT